MEPRLVIVSGPDQGKSFEIPKNSRVVVGRGKDSTTLLTDPHCSRVHCQIHQENDSYFLVDLGSSAGTFVNGQRAERMELTPGDTIQVGNTVFRFESPDPAVGRTIPPPSLSDQETPVPANKKLPPKKPTSEAPLGKPSAAKKGPLPAAPANPGRATPEIVKGGTTMAQPPDLPAERLHELDGHQIHFFRIGNVLGKGRSGLVFRAQDIRNNQPIALKILFSEFAQDEDEIQRFIRAMKTMLPLRHQNLVTLLGAGKKGPYCWISMELIEGESLATMLQNMKAPIFWPFALHVAKELAQVLHFAHQNQIIHRNVCPQNVLMNSQTRQIKLGDLMLAKATEGKLAQQITRPGEVLGDMRYTSPERIMDPASVDQRTDLYGLGATVYHLLTNRPPVEGSNILETIQKIRLENPPPVRGFQPQTPPVLEGIIHRLLSKDPNGRYPTAAHLLKDLIQIPIPT